MEVASDLLLMLTAQISNQNPACTFSSCAQFCQTDTLWSKLPGDRGQYVNHTDREDSKKTRVALQEQWLISDASGRVDGNVDYLRLQASTGLVFSATEMILRGR